MKKILKKAILYFGVLVTFPLVIIYRLTGSRSMFSGQSQLLSLIPGKLGSYLRVAYYSKTLKSCPLEGYIGFGTFFAHPEVEIGRGVYIGSYCIIGMSTIGDHATIASHVSILSGKRQHGYKEIGKPIQEQEGEFSCVQIGANCWIGNNAVIMADLGVQNVVAAGSVVVDKTDNYKIIAGNPGKVIKDFNTDAHE